MTTLSSDRPNSDPGNDLFGHSPFAKSLSDSLCSYPGNDGIVFALHGPWGSGKSTVLSYVEYHIEQRPVSERPVIVNFNPWWFSGQENLARAFLGQLQAVLPQKSEKFKQLGDLLADFAEGVGGAIDLTGVTGGAGTVVGKILGKCKRAPKDVPALKDAIASILAESDQRVLVIVDDIDRLSPDEVRQLFTVIKALADFPNVVYLLAFDREVACEAIENQTGLRGPAFLEKIVQVPFELPPVDRVAMRGALFQRLKEVLGDYPAGTFDQSYWTNVYHDGIDALIQVPRDVVRLTNTLLVTFPAVVGEVNVVDFVALEALRVFLPDVYDLIRSNPERITGHGRDQAVGANGEALRPFREVLMEKIPDSARESTIDMLERVFPKIEQMEYGPDWLAQWRRSLRACHPEVFATYFRLSLPLGAVSRFEMDALLGLAGDTEEFGNVLLRAKDEKRPDGTSKARAILERLMDHVGEEISVEHAPSIICSLLGIGDMLIDPADELGMYDTGNITRCTRPAYHLLKQIDQDKREPTLAAGIATGHGIVVQARLLRALEEEAVKGGADASLLSSDSVEKLKEIWVDRVRELSIEDGFVSGPELSSVLRCWLKWGDKNEVRSWASGVIAADDALFQLVSQFLQHSKSNTMGDRAIRLQPRLNPTWMEDYIDLAACTARLQALEGGGNVPEEYREAVSQYLKEKDMLEQRIDPDGFDAFDD